MSRINKFLTPENVLLAYIFFSFVGFQPFALGVDELSSIGDNSMVRRFAFLLFLGVSIFFVLLRGSSPWRFVGKNWPYIVFSLFLIFSAIWSVLPQFTFVRSILFLISVLVLIFLVSSIDCDLFLRKLAIFLAVLLLLSVVSVFLLPSARHSDATLSGLWRGIFLHKNDAGFAMVISIFLFIYSYLKSGWRGWILLSGIATLFLVFSGSKTSLGLLLVGIAFGLLYSGMVRSIRVRVLCTFIVVVAIFFSLFLFVQSDHDYYLNSFFFDPDGFTGRVLIWEHVLLMIFDRPFLGYGFGAVWGVGDESILLDYASNAPLWLFTVVNAHNSYLDVILHLGVVGFFLFIYLFIFQHIFLSRKVLSLEFHFVFLFYGFFWFVIFHGLLETNFLLPDNGRWVVFFLFLLLRSRLIQIHTKGTSE